MSEERKKRGARKLCDLDLEIYRCVTPDLRTREVIITEERIAHIRARHPGDYERFFSYIPQMILVPDYIVKDTRPDTALGMKSVADAREDCRRTLRLAAPADNPSYKNSVITFLKIREKEWERVIRNKIVLYKRG